MPGIMIDVAHQKIHEGNYYTANYLEKGLANLGFMRLHIKTGRNSAHIIFQAEIEGKVYFKSYSEPVITADGTAPDATKLTLFNRCGICGNGNKTQVFYNPSYSSLGTLRGNRMFPGGTGGNATGGTGGERIESIFQKNSSYIVEIQNVSGQARDIGLILEWYEVSDGKDT